LPQKILERAGRKYSIIMAMNEDDIKIQPSAALLPAETPIPSETPVAPADTASSTDPENDGDKIVEITDDFNITPVLTDIPVPPAPPVMPITPISPVIPTPVAPIIAAVPGKPATKAPHITPNLKRLRTYEGDVAEVLANKKISTTSIALAENRKSTGEDRIGSVETPPDAAESTADKSGSETSSGVGKKILIAIASLALIGIGIIGAYYLYSISPLVPSRATPQPQVVQSMIPSDTQIAIPIDGMSPTAVISAVRSEVAKPQAINTIKEIVLVQTKNGQHFRIAGPDMANIMDTGAPDIVLRALADDWMLGVYADPNGTKTVFVLATIDYFQNAFAGMLQWESVMADDLKQYLYANAPADIAAEAVLANPITATSTSNASTTRTTASTTAVSTTSNLLASQYAMINQPVVMRGNFIDRIVQNKDVREFVTTDGKTLFLYSFIDDTKLVITGSESALSEILKRLEQQAFVR
jgi:hypothetical protein